MKTRFLAFSLVAAVSSYFPVSQLTAHEPNQPIETTRLLDEPSPGNEVALEQDADLTEGLTISEEQVIREEAIAIDELIDQTDANDGEFQDIWEELGDEDEQSVLVDEFDEPESTAVAEEEAADEEAADELLEFYEVPNQVTASVDADDDVQVAEDAAAEDAEATEQEVTEFVTDEASSEEFDWAEGYDDWYYEDEFAAEEPIEEAASVEETVEPIEAVEVEDNIAVVDSAIEEASSEEFDWAEGYDDWYYEDEFAAEEPIEEAASVEETVEPIEAVEVEDNIAVVDSAIEEAIDEETVYIVETEESEDTEATEEIATDEGLAVEAEVVERSGDESDEGDVATEDSIEEVRVVEETVETTEAVEVADSVEANEPANEELASDALIEDVEWSQDYDEWFDESEYAVEALTEEEITVDEADETAEANDDGESPLAVDSLEEEVFEQELVEDVQYIIAGPSSVIEDNIEEQVSEDVDIAANENLETDATDGVAEIEATTDVFEPLIEEADLQETESESTTDDVNEPEAATVRTIELGDCTISIQSERQMEDFELLEMLMEAVYQLEAEMD